MYKDFAPKTYFQLLCWPFGLSGTAEICLRAATARAKCRVHLDAQHGTLTDPHHVQKPSTGLVEPSIGIGFPKDTDDSHES